LKAGDAACYGSRPMYDGWLPSGALRGFAI
jgi:hypothetical protein